MQNSFAGAKSKRSVKGSDIKRTSRRTVRKKYENNSAAIKASERSWYWNDPDAVQLAKHMPYQTHPDLKRAAEKTRYRRGIRTTTTTQRYVIAFCIALALKSEACNMCKTVHVRENHSVYSHPL